MIQLMLIFEGCSWFNLCLYFKAVHCSTCAYIGRLFMVQPCLYFKAVHCSTCD